MSKIPTILTNAKTAIMGYSCFNGRVGLLLNVYTLKEYRRRGLAFELITKLIEKAKQMGVGKILLDYTEDGFELYRKLGFEKLDREMVLKLSM